LLTKKQEHPPMRGRRNFLPRFCPRFSALGIVAVMLVSFAIAQNRDDSGSAPRPRISTGGNYEPASPGTPLPAGNVKATERLREGTRLIDVTGALASIGPDNVTFSPDGSRDSYRLLENLALQRVSQVLDENRDPRKWVVSGLITEYRGANYLLLTKAVVLHHDGDSASGH
jgi:hypothetical protein